MSANIKDVAKLAGVSISTASNVLNKKGYISENTRKKVLAAARKLNYKPNALARGLVTGASKTVGVLIPDLSDPYFAEVVKGVDKCARENGYSVILCNTDRDHSKEEFYFKNLKERRVDGIIFAGSGREGDRYIIDDEDFSGIVVIGNHNTPFNACLVDDANALDEITSYLIKLGHNRIGLITGPLEFNVTKDRIRGYQSALNKAGIKYNQLLVIEEDFREIAGQKAADILLDLSEGKRPTAIIAQNDQMAFGAISAAWRRGMRIPQDIAIVGYDDIPMANLACPPLTTIKLPMQEMGYSAMKMIIDGKNKTEISTETSQRKVISFPYKIIIRGTT